MEKQPANRLVEIDEQKKAIERIEWKGSLLAYIVRAEDGASRTTFLTPPDSNFQFGFVVYPQGGQIARHVHQPVERRIVGTSEFILVRNGHCEIDIYTDAKEKIATRELRSGDIVVMVDGGHGFRMIADTVLLEIKQGPYSGLEEKVRF